MPARQRFFVDLKDGETTVVSWKKLTSDADKSMSSGAPSDAPVGANPALEARIAPDVQVNLFFLGGDFCLFFRCAEERHRNLRRLSWCSLWIFGEICDCA
jgi:hypothetical protein